MKAGRAGPMLRPMASLLSFDHVLPPSCLGGTCEEFKGGEARPSDIAVRFKFCNAKAQAETLTELPYIFHRHYVVSQIDFKPGIGATIAKTWVACIGSAQCHQR